jgi:hypothetical protein
MGKLSSRQRRGIGAGTFIDYQLKQLYRQTASTVCAVLEKSRGQIESICYNGDGENHFVPEFSIYASLRNHFFVRK